MIYALLDLTGTRVLDVLAISGNIKVDPAEQRAILKKEAEAAYRKLTGNSREFSTLEKARTAVASALAAECFSAGNAANQPVEGPVAIVHRICNEMQGRKRWEVIEACAAAGVKRSTASVQYQQRRKAMGLVAPRAAAPAAPPMH